MRSSIVKSVLLVAIGIAAAVYMARLTWDGMHDGGVATILPVLLGLMTAAVTLTTWGVAIFMGRKKAPDPKAGGDYRHVYPLFGAIGGIIVLAVVARNFAVPPTFGQFGFYRGAAPAEAREKEQRHVGQKSCEQCHADVTDAHDKDMHAAVPCESCHGPGWKHAEAGGMEPMLKPTRGQEFRKLCLTCHLRQPARPKDFAQIDWSEHVQAVGAKDENVDCKSCHDPHEPLYLSGDLRTALKHPMVARVFTGDPSAEDITASMSAGAPKPSDCAFCHQTVVKDFADRTHSRQRCTNCHAFVKESDTYGRMVKNRDSHLCLRCHSGGDHRSEEWPAPTVKWPDHATSKGVEEHKAQCINCHQESVHGKRKGPHANG